MDWTKLFPQEFGRADNPKLRRYGLIMAVPLGLIAAALFWKANGAAPYWAAGAVLFAALGLVLPGALKPVYVAWMTLAFYLSFVMTYVVLTLFFILIMTPVGLLIRILGKDPMKRRFPGSEDSYWIKAQVFDNTVDRYSKPY